MKIIGKIKLPSGEVVLDDQGVWHGDNETVLYKLRSDFNPKRMTGIANILPFGVQAVTEGAIAVGGQVELFVKVPKVEEGEVS